VFTPHLALGFLSFLLHPLLSAHTHVEADGGREEGGKIKSFVT
jgi:hypothetical protein